jgi:hypothetical protein
MVSPMTAKVAICFFGITRSLTHTHASIEKNVLAPARSLATPKIYAHFFRQQALDNPRSGEKGRMNGEEYRLLNSDWLRLEEPDGCLDRWGFERLKSWGDSWEDEFRSLRNLVHQLHSLNAVTEAALADGAEICLFCRPDLRYHDSLRIPLQQALKAQHDQAAAGTVFLPYWQAHGGLNDRFAICVGREAIAAYGQRIRLAEQFCRERAEPLNSEYLVAYSLAQRAIAARRIGARASRVRLDGVQRYEDFSRPLISRIKRQTNPVMTALADRVGLRTAARWFLKRIRP